MPPQLERLLLWQLINPPVPVLLHLNESVLLEIAKVFGDIDLRLLQHGLEMTHAERRVRE